MFDMRHKKIKSGDVLKFDNNNCYLVYKHKKDFVIKNISRHTPTMNLEYFAKNSIVPAIIITNIDIIYWFMTDCVL